MSANDSNLRFAKRLLVLPSGDFEEAGVLACQNRGDDVWIRLGPPRTFYSVDTTCELTAQCVNH